MRLSGTGPIEILGSRTSQSIWSPQVRALSSDQITRDGTSGDNYRGQSHVPMARRAAWETIIEFMFELIFVPPVRVTAFPSLAPADVLLRPVAAPDEDAVWSLAPRAVELAVRGGGWAVARVLAWAWNPTGKPVVWKCAVDLGSTVIWFGYDARLLRPADAAALA